MPSLILLAVLLKDKLQAFAGSALWLPFGSRMAAEALGIQEL